MSKVTYSSMLSAGHTCFLTNRLASLAEATVYLARMIACAYPAPIKEARIRRINGGRVNDVALADVRRRISEAIDKIERDGKRGRRK